MPATLVLCSGCEAVISQFAGTSVQLVEPLGIYHETQLVAIASVAGIGFSPSTVQLNYASQTFQIGSDGNVYVLASLTPYQTLTYKLLP